MQTDSHILARDIHLSVPLVTRRRPTIRSFSVVRDLMGQGKERQLRPLIRGISFEFNDGDRVGLIGANGAGKTTLLRVLAGVLRPSSGRLEVSGKTQNLLNVSMGMEKDATGMENIYLRGYCAGMSKKEIERHIPDILEFAGLENVIDDPVRTYSSGMQLRLAFAVATTVQPEILILDEWISAGDRFFVQRSRERLMGHIDSCRMLVFASHSPELLVELCTRGLVLKSGKVVFDGGIEDALAFYESDQYQEA